ncbi:copia-type polyprotein, partial [Trifolium medium]|nr:copia-type polyprotein [Trifolium medium]
APVIEVRARSTRTRQVPTRLQECELVNDNEVNEESELVHFALLAGDEPINYIEALKDKKWKKAMEEELTVIERNQTWEIMELPSDKKAIEVKWIFKLKLNPDGSIAKHKTRLVARGLIFAEGRVIYFKI